MRKMMMVVLAMVSMSACNNSRADKTAVDPTAAIASFDGADYKDEAAKMAHGKRLADVLDCTGCHGANLQGANVTADDPEFGDMNAPNLTLKLRDYSDAGFVKLLRTGVPKDGREIWFMAPESYQFMAPADMTALLAYLRSFAPAGTQLPPIRKGPGFIKEATEGGIKPAAQQVIRYRDNPPLDLGPNFERGRKLAQINCTGCHNGALEGYPGFTPNLDIAGAYNNAELTELLTTGKGKSRPDLGLMTIVARHSFSKFTPGERKEIVDYVLARANHEPQEIGDE